MVYERDAERIARRRNQILEQYAKQDQQTRANVIGALCKHSDGRLFLAWLLEITKAIGVNAFTGNALTTAFNTGEQNIGQQLMAEIILTNEDLFVSILKEKANVRRTRDLDLANTASGTDGTRSGSDGNENRVQTDGIGSGEDG